MAKPAKKKPAKRSVKNPKHPAATYPRAKLKLPKGVDPQRKRAAPRAVKNPAQPLHFAWKGEGYTVAFEGDAFSAGYPIYKKDADDTWLPVNKALQDKQLHPAFRALLNGLVHRSIVKAAAGKATVSPRVLTKAASTILSGKLDAATLAKIAAVVKAPKDASLGAIAKRVNEVAGEIAVATLSAAGVPKPLAQAGVKVSRAIQAAQVRAAKAVGRGVTKAAKWAGRKIKGKKNGRVPTPAEQLELKQLKGSMRASLKAEQYEREQAKKRAAKKKNPLLPLEFGEAASLIHQLRTAAPTDKAFQRVALQRHKSMVNRLALLGEEARASGDEFTARREEKLRGLLSEALMAYGARSSRAGSANPKKSVKKGARKGAKANGTTTKRPKKAAGAKDFASISKLFLEYRALFAKTYPNVRYIGLMVDPAIHDSARHFAMTGVLPAGQAFVRPGPVPAPTVLIAPELARESKAVQTGIIIHEIAHSVFQLNYLTEPKGYDANERATDKLAEQVTGLKIYYDKRGVEVAGRGARGKSPRPAGLR
jgi:hypothetical protein